MVKEKVLKYISEFGITLFSFIAGIAIGVSFLLFFNPAYLSYTYSLTAVCLFVASMIFSYKGKSKMFLASFGLGSGILFILLLLQSGGIQFASDATF